MLSLRQETAGGFSILFKRSHCKGGGAEPQRPVRVTTSNLVEMRVTLGRVGW